MTINYPIGAICDTYAPIIPVATHEHHGPCDFYRFGEINIAECEGAIKTCATCPAEFCESHGSTEMCADCIEKLVDAIISEVTQ